jgi:hypothetical protein
LTFLLNFNSFKDDKLRVKLLWLFFLFPSVAWPLPWSTDMHHIEPLMNESMEALNRENGSPPICNDATSLKYISPLPKKEPWRSYYKMPKLLTDNFYKVKDVCMEAKKMNAAQGVSKKYALVGHKTHLCDFGHHACLSMLKSLSDPCNHFVQDNFQVFHSRIFIGQHRPAGYREMMNEYGKLGPSLVVIDLESCTIMPTVKGKAALKEGMNTKAMVRDNFNYTPPSLEAAKDAKGVHKFKSESEQIRFGAIRESLTTNVPELKKLEQGRKDCYVNGKRSLPGISDIESVQYGEVKIKGAAAMRKLMDEQYIDVTGTNPYEIKK